jgi:hypothetical protein
VELRVARGGWTEAALALAIVLAGWSAHRANVWLEGHVLETRVAGEVGPLPDGRALRVASLGFERLVADLFWLRTIYYLGDEESEAAGFPAAARLATLVTDIDPWFTTAYVVMNSALTVLTHEPDAAFELMEKGLRYNDGYWKLHFLQGFTLFFEREQYVEAADHMRAAYERGGPKYLQLLAARLYAQGGSPETALAFIEARMKQTKDPKARRKLRWRYYDIWIDRDFKLINPAIAAYRATHGEDPATVADLVAAGLLDREPHDPKGNTYLISGGRARPQMKWREMVVHRAETAS